MTETFQRISGPAGFRRSQPATRAPVVLLAGFGLLAGAVAFVAGSPAKSVALAVTGVFLCMVAGLFWLAMTTVRDGYVRIDPAVEGLSFVPLRRFERIEDVAMAVLVVPGTLIAAASLTGLDRQAMSSPWSVLVVAASVVLPAKYLWTLRAPRGLTLTPMGVRGVRRIASVDLGWDDVKDLSVQDGPGRGTLIIPGRGHRLVRLDAMRFGSDAHLVAEIIKYFADHERERGLLTDGPRALRGFSASLEQD